MGSPGIPGCLTSEDEERETWTAESLRGLEYLKTSVFIFRDWTKDFGGTRFKGYTIVVSDVNRRRYIWWDLVKRCDQPV